MATRESGLDEFGYFPGGMKTGLPLSRKSLSRHLFSGNDCLSHLKQCGNAQIGDCQYPNLEEPESEDTLKAPCESDERIPSTTMFSEAIPSDTCVSEFPDGAISVTSEAEVDDNYLTLLQKIPRECQVCYEACDLACKACYKVFYCSKNHQIADWSRHKNDCFPAIIAKNKDGEKILVATQDIPQNGKILKERPFLIVPSTKESLDHICLGCYEEVETSVSCSKCKWDVCSEKCEKESMHSENECDIFARKKLLPPIACNAIQLMDAVATLRCLLMKERDQEKWRRFTSLNSISRHKPLPMEELDRLLNAKNCIKFIREECGLVQFDHGLIERTLKNLNINKFHVPDIPSTIRDCRRAALLFKNFFVPATSCIPNARWAMSGRGNMKYCGMIGASVDIKKGQEIHCDFTQDPTEYGTYLTAVNCRDNPGCRGGNLLPENPLDNCTAWVCDKCGDRVDAAYVVTKINHVSEELVNVGYDIDESALKELDQVIKKYKGNILHENHFLIMNAQYDYIHRVMQHSTHLAMYDMKASWGEKVIEFAKQLLTVTEFIMPGLHRFKGRVVYCLQIGLLISIFGMKSNPAKKRVSSITRRYRQKKYEETLDAQRLALEFLAFEPEDSDEGAIVKILKEQLDQGHETIIELPPMGIHGSKGN
ncbi:unnamed protein product [Allacma fusca]|uniref:MYND-type domain-containing protein n=1 Tax=Allacma fusca TaxID=39272 RepID=A0A8J2JRN6_9HEXA|nr:unnamed protein product [Allacma fusca]